MPIFRDTQLWMQCIILIFATIPVFFRELVVGLIQVLKQIMLVEITFLWLLAWNKEYSCSTYICSLALHPHKQILCTTSDDHTWKIWAVPSGDPIFTGSGHTEWVSDCEFHPKWVNQKIKKYENGFFSIKLPFSICWLQPWQHGKLERIGSQTR